MSTRRIIKVFIASPSDLAEERRQFKDTIDELNRGFGDGAKVQFVPLGWEDALATTGRRAQSVINKDIDSCDFFVLVMWRRWGQEAPDAEPKYSSYTEEEFYRALDRMQNMKSPAICVLFKHVEAAQIADAGPQLTKVLEFRRKLEESRSVLYRTFGSVKDFHVEIDRHLRAFAEGELDCASDGTGCNALLPKYAESVISERDKECKAALEELGRTKQELQEVIRLAELAEKRTKDAEARAIASEQIVEAKIAKRRLEMASTAAKNAIEGRIEEARQGFAQALDGTTDCDVLFLGCQFFDRIGELDEAERLARRRLAICGRESRSTQTARTLSNLGVIEARRGNFSQAESLQKESMLMAEHVGDEAGVSRALGNLGAIEYNKGNPDAAEAYAKKAIGIDERLGRPQGMSVNYNILGLVELSRSNLPEAESLFKQSLALDEPLGETEGTASCLMNLGLVEEARGNSDAARKLWTRSLDQFKKLGIRRGVAVVEPLLASLANPTP